MRKEINKKRMIILIVLAIILLLSIVLVTSLFNGNFKKNTIKAVKIEKNNGIERTIKYEIKINDFDIYEVKKIIKLNSKDNAQTEYERYEFINKYERRNIGLELKEKKLILTMPVDQLKEDIGYDNKNNIIYVSRENEQKEVINQDAIKDALQSQGYTIK